MSPEAAFQDALIAHLSGDPDVQAELGNPARIHDRAPGGTRFPFAEVSRGESDPADADGVILLDHRLTVRMFSRRGDHDRLKAVVGAVRSAAHNANLTLAGDWTCVSCRVVYSDMFRDEAGRHYQGIVRIRALLQHTP